MAPMDFAPPWRHLRNLLYHLTEPHPTLWAAEQRQAARVLSALVLGFIVFLLATLITQMTGLSGLPPAMTLKSALALLLSCALYGVSRTRYYLLAAWVFIGGVAIFVLATALYYPSAAFIQTMLMYPVVAVLIGSLIFSLRTISFIAVLGLGLSTLITLAGDYPTDMTFSIINLNVLLCGVVMVNAFIRQYNHRQMKIQADTLEHERNLLRVVIDALPDAIYVKDTESRFMLVNHKVLQDQRAEQASELVGKSDLDVIGPDVWETTRAEDLRILQTGQPLINLERSWRDRDGQLNWWLVTKVPLRDSSGQIIGLVGIDRNITDRKRVECALEKQRLLLQAVMDNVPDQIYIKDTESRFVLVNAAVLRRHDLATPDDIIGKTDADLFPGETGTRYLQMERPILEQGESFINYELSYVKHGVTHWMLNTKVPLYDEDGRITGLIGINRDVTDRRLIEGELLQERNLLRTLIENLPDAVYVKDTESRFLLGNRASWQRFGLASMDELLGKTDFDLLPPETARKFYDDEQRIMQTGQPLIGQEASGVDASGESFTIHITKIPLRDSEGRVIGLIGINHDITHRKQVEDVLAAERNLLRAIINSVPEPLYVKDTSLRFVLANSITWQNAGMNSMDELLGKTDFDIADPHFAALLSQQEQHIIDTGQPLINHEFSGFDNLGRPYAYLITKVPVRDSEGRITGLVGLNHDITELRLAEWQLRYQATLMENISDAVISTNLDFEILSWNRGAEALYGWQADEVKGQRMSEVVPLQDPVSPEPLIDDLQHSGHWKGEVIQKRRDGRDVPIFSSVSLVRDSDGRPIGAVAINHDISEQKAAEQHRVELALERERMMVLRRFISDISHDLRNPLATVRVSLYLLSRLADDAERRQHHLNVMDTQVERLETMINDLLSISNLDQTTEEFTFRPEDINALVSEVITHQQLLAYRRDQELILHAANDLPPVLCDRSKLSRAVTNLVANALNYTPVGGLICVSIHRVNDSIHISVEDNGIGISEEDLPRIFQRFYRADKARSSDTGGTGLGLSITQRIVEAHGGELTVVSTLGQGSTFTIILPLARQDYAGADLRP